MLCTIMVTKHLYIHNISSIRSIGPLPMSLSIHLLDATLFWGLERTDWDLIIKFKILLTMIVDHRDTAFFSPYVGGTSTSLTTSSPSLNLGHTTFVYISPSFDVCIVLRTFSLKCKEASTVCAYKYQGKLVSRKHFAGFSTFFFFIF